MKLTNSEYMRKLLDQFSEIPCITGKNLILIESSSKNRWNICYSFSSPDGQLSVCNVGIPARDIFQAKSIAYRDAQKKGRDNVKITSIKKLNNAEIRENVGSNLIETYHLDISKDGRPKDHFIITKHIENAVGRRKSAAALSFGTWMITWEFANKADAEQAEKSIKEKFPDFSTCITNIAY